MEKEYRELFDEVHASQRLRMEVMNMKHEETKHAHRIPRAALVAAALALVLAGTAVAAEHLGWIKIEPVSGWLGPDGPVDGDGYTLTYENDGRFPAESLSKEVFAIGEEIGDVHYPRRTIPFESWAACEKFLGVELADNPQLERMGKDTVRIEDFDGSVSNAHAYVNLSYAKRMPSCITVSAYYKEGDISVSQDATLRTQYAFESSDPEDWDLLVPQNGEEPLAQETYIAPDGTEAVILTDTYDIADVAGFTTCYASFIKSNARFTLAVSVRTHNYQEPTNAPDALEVIKEILDAYE